MVDSHGRWLQPPRFMAEVHECPGCKMLAIAAEAIDDKDRVSRPRLVPFRKDTPPDED